jgi:hypothetical protein
VHFTPTGSSWLNPVERWLAFLTQQLLRRGVHRSVAALEKDVRNWIDRWNANPRPFVWRKTAEEILDSLARYLQRLSGTLGLWWHHLFSLRYDAPRCRCCLSSPVW